MRFIVKNESQTAIECLTLDETLCQMKKDGKIPDTIFLWKPAKFIYLLKNASMNHINRDYAESLGYQVLRGGTLLGGATSLLIVGSMWNIITAVSKDENVSLQTHSDMFGKNMWIYIAKKLGCLLDSKGNDLVISGTDRKVSGTGIAEINSAVIFQNCFFSEKIPVEVDMNKLFIMPEQKFADKEVKTPTARITSLEIETGKIFDEEWLINTVIEYFNLIGVNIERENDFTQDEKDFARSLESKHSSEEWIKYGELSKPDFI